MTVLAAGSPHQLMNEWTRDPRELIETYAATMRANLLTYSIWAGNYVIVVGRQHRDVLHAAGWSKRDVREFIHERARVKREDWRSVGKGVVVPREVGDPCSEREAHGFLGVGGEAAAKGNVRGPRMGQEPP